MPPTRPSVPTMNPSRPIPTTKERARQSFRTAATSPGLIYWLIVTAVFSVILLTGGHIDRLYWYLGGSAITFLATRTK